MIVICKKLREAADRKWPDAGNQRHSLFSQAADEIERLRARVLELEAVHEDASGAILEAVEAERERCAKICEAEADRWAGVGSAHAERLCAALIRGA